MTREEIIEQLDSIVGTYEILIGDGVNSDILDVDDIEAIREAIKALEQEPCEDKKQKLEKEYLFESLCEDLKKLQTENEKLRNALEQEPKTGHWMVEIWNNREHHTCSECNHVVDYEPCYHYCPYCGAKMEVEE